MSFLKVELGSFGKKLFWFGLFLIWIIWTADFFIFDQYLANYDFRQV